MLLHNVYKMEFKASTFWDNAHTTILGAGSNTESLDAEIYAEVPGFASTYFYGQHDCVPVMIIL